MGTEEIKELYSERDKIEAKNAELKSDFSYDKANQSKASAADAML